MAQAIVKLIVWFDNSSICLVLVHQRDKSFLIIFLLARNAISYYVFSNIMERTTQSKILIEEMNKIADSTHAKLLQRYFKTGPGEYGEGGLQGIIYLKKIKQSYTILQNLKIYGKKE